MDNTKFEASMAKEFERLTAKEDREYLSLQNTIEEQNKIIFDLRKENYQLQKTISEFPTVKLLAIRQAREEWDKESALQFQSNSKTLKSELEQLKQSMETQYAIRLEGIKETLEAHYEIKLQAQSGGKRIEDTKKYAQLQNRLTKLIHNNTVLRNKLMRATLELKTKREKELEQAMAPPPPVEFTPEQKEEYVVDMKQAEDQVNAFLNKLMLEQGIELEENK